MKHYRHILLFIIMTTFLGQVLLPGVVLCRGEEGHVAVESAFDQCCSPAASVSTGTSGALMHFEEAAGEYDDCGPCSDTLLSADPCTKPSEEQHSCTPPAATEAARAADNCDAGVLSAKTATISPLLALIPIKTTILLI